MYLEITELDFGGGCNDIGLIDPPEGHAIHLEGAGHK